MQRVKSGLTGNDFRFINAVPVTAANMATHAGAAPGPAHLDPDDTLRTLPLRHRLHCAFFTAIPWKAHIKTILHPRPNHVAKLYVGIFALALCADGCCANRVDPPKSITVQAMHDGERVPRKLIQLESES